MKQIKRGIAFIMCVIVCLSLTMEAQATVNNNIRIYEFGEEELEVVIDMAQMQRGNELNCSMMISKTNSGAVEVIFSTSTGPVSSEIGVKDLVFQQKGWLWWTDLYCNSFCNYNAHSYAGSVTYTAPESGETYRAIGTHYAIIDGTEYTYVMISDELDY
ncbi:MAG: hypothetical protein J6B85_14170 [Lachnospiraceae bacterium]|nr:hypothetical protein [Lachnospiraceae bacterium]